MKQSCCFSSFVFMIVNPWNFITVNIPGLTSKCVKSCFTLVLNHFTGQNLCKWTSHHYIIKHKSQPFQYANSDCMRSHCAKLHVFSNLYYSTVWISIWEFMCRHIFLMISWFLENKFNSSSKNCLHMCLVFHIFDFYNQSTHPFAV